MRAIKTFQLLIIIFLFIYPFPMTAQNLDSLNDQQKALIAVSANTATGNSALLISSINNGLDAGLTINQVKEAMVQLYAYCGFPRSLNALNVLKTVVEGRKSKGIKDAVGTPGKVENKVVDKYEQGRKTLEKLTKTEQKKPAPGFGEFAPRIDVFLKEHLFADVFANTVLNHQQREIVTISALAAMVGVTPQLRSHIAIGKNTGLTNLQLKNLAGIIEENVSITQANLVLNIIGEDEKPVLQPDLMVRIAEIEVIPQYLEQYLEFAKEVAAQSVEKEPGVISVFPMQTKENPNLISILEIYSSKKVYDAHIASDHFQKYKTSTPQMIKSLKLVDMNMLVPDNLFKIFKRLHQ